MLLITTMLFCSSISKSHCASNLAIRVRIPFLCATEIKRNESIQLPRKARGGGWHISFFPSYENVLLQRCFDEVFLRISVAHVPQLIRPRFESLRRRLHHRGRKFHRLSFCQDYGALDPINMEINGQTLGNTRVPQEGRGWSGATVEIGILG